MQKYCLNEVNRIFDHKLDVTFGEVKTWKSEGGCRPTGVSADVNFRKAVVRKLKVLCV